MRRRTGRVAVVTGAASGIGRAMAMRFAAEGMGCVLADIETEPLDRVVAELRRSGAAAIAVRTDVIEVWEWVLGVTLWGAIHGCRMSSSPAFATSGSTS